MNPQENNPTPENNQFPDTTPTEPTTPVDTFATPTPTEPEAPSAPVTEPAPTPDTMTSPAAPVTDTNPVPSEPIQTVSSTAAPAAVNPGQTLGIVGFIMAFVGLQIVGLILSIIGLKKSKAAGMNNGWALAGIILNGLSIVLAILIIVLILASGGLTANT